MKKIFLITFVFFISTISFAQNIKVEEIKIESGVTQKKYENGKLKEFMVSIFAVNYGNALFFTQNNNEILVENGEDKNSIIKFFIENKKLIKSFIYKKEEIIRIESISLDLNSLPKNSIIVSNFKDNVINSFSIKQNLDSFYEDSDNDRNPDKSLKLFYGLDIPQEINTIDSTFNYLGDFFSKEDALLKIFYAEYRASIENEKEINYLNYFKTNKDGKIKQGILWKNNNINSLEGIYEIYRNEKIIKSEKISSKKYNEIIKKYLEKELDF